jgi:hypothetical protein
VSTETKKAIAREAPRLRVAPEALEAWVLEGLRVLYPNGTDDARLYSVELEFQHANGNPKAEALVWADLIFKFRTVGHLITSLRP